MLLMCSPAVDQKPSGGQGHSHTPSQRDGGLLSRGGVKCCFSHFVPTTGRNLNGTRLPAAFQMSDTLETDQNTFLAIDVQQWNSETCSSAEWEKTFYCQCELSLTSLTEQWLSVNVYVCAVAVSLHIWGPTIKFDLGFVVRLKVHISVGLKWRGK